MKIIKYFFQFIIILIFFVIFKILGKNHASNFAGKILSMIGIFFLGEPIMYFFRSASINMNPSFLNVLFKNLANCIYATFNDPKVKFSLLSSSINSCLSFSAKRLMGGRTF